MDTDKAEKIAVDKIRELIPSWKFKWGGMKTFGGLANFRNKIIKISKDITEINNESVFYEILYHEIAHAIVGSLNNHNEVWKKKCIELGGSGNIRGSWKKPLKKYIYVCPVCGQEYYRHRKYKNNVSCGKCSKIYDERFKLILKNKI